MNEAVVKSKSIRDTFDVDVIPIRFASSSVDIGRFTMRKIALTISVAMKLAVICARRSPDLVYFTLVPIGAAFYRDLLFVGIVKLYRIPLVYHLHGRGIREAGRSRFNQRIYEWVFDKATIVHLSQRLYSDIERFVPPERCVFLSNGVEDMGTTPRQADRHAGADSVRLLFLSNMKVLKGPLVFLEALALLRKWNVNCHAVFVGPWSERGCEEMFIRMVGSEHLEEMVSYLGPKYGKEKFVVLRESDIFVFPTLHPWESFPLVVLEAMSVGKPVVATRTGAIEDMVENGVTGLLSPPGDVEALSRALEMLIRDSEMRVQMGENGRKRYLERFTLERFEEGITSILRRAATSANTASFKSDGPGVPPP